MLQVKRNDAAANCAGMTRRTFLNAGFLGAAGLSLADLFRLREAAAAEGRAPKNTACILIWLDGGPSQLDTYDPKPEAPAEIRGYFDAIETTAPGMRLSSLLAKQAKWGHRMAIVPGVHHDNGDHFAAAHWMLTGRLGSNSRDKAQKFPSVGSYVARVRGPNRADLPAYVGVPAAESVYLFPGYQGSAYLGPAYNPFAADRDHKYIGSTSKGKAHTPKLFKAAANEGRLTERRRLLAQVDHVAAEMDRSGAMTSYDTYTQKAFELLLSRHVREAFDLDAEPEKIKQRYGESDWGRYTLLARRLVERGVTFVTVDMPHWDHHDNIKAAIQPQCRALDAAVHGLFSDLEERGMFDHVLVVVMGEFGRTPKLNHGLPQLGRNIPGRDHWGNAISVMMAGGGLRMGQVVGRTDADAAYPAESPHSPGDILATIYHVLGIDPHLVFHDGQNRPFPILPQGKAIRELI